MDDHQSCVVKSYKIIRCFLRNILKDFISSSGESKDRAFFSTRNIHLLQYVTDCTLAPDS